MNPEKTSTRFRMDKDGSWVHVGDLTRELLKAADAIELKGSVEAATVLRSTVQVLFQSVVNQP